MKQRECEGTEDNTSSAAPQLLSLAASVTSPSPPISVPLLLPLREGSEHGVSGWRGHCFLSQNGTHPGLEDSNPLVTIPLPPLFSRAVTVHTCLEGPVNRVAPLRQPAGPSRASRQEGQRCGSRGSEFAGRSHAGCGLREGACPCVVGIQATLNLPVMCPVFSNLHGVFASLPSPVSAELHPPERVPLADLQKSTLCARVGLLGLEP